MNQPDTRTFEEKVRDAEAASAALRDPSPRLRAAAKVIHDAAVYHGWGGPYYTQTYEELEQKDPIGFEEFNEIVADALAAADQTQKSEGV